VKLSAAMSMARLWRDQGKRAERQWLLRAWDRAPTASKEKRPDEIAAGA